MIRIFLFGLLLLVGCQTPVFTQSVSNQGSMLCQHCLPQGITFSAQSQIDSFQINYPGCTKIAGIVIIDGYDITNLTGLSDLTSLGGDILIGDVDAPWPFICNPLLTELTGLNNIRSIAGSLTVVYNNALTDLSGMDGLAAISGNLNLWSNDNLTNLEGLNNLVSIGQSMLIGGNYYLDNLSAFHNLKEVGMTIYISGNDSLHSLAGLQNLDSVAGDLYIWFNDLLTDLSGLDNLNYIGGSLNISSNGELINLSGLDNLNFIGEELVIGGPYATDGNHSLVSLAGLNKVTSIGGSLEIGWNSSLTSLTGLDNIDPGSIMDLMIRNNDSLSTCEVQSICDYLAAPNRTILIIHNAPGCDSPYEVNEACKTVGIEEINNLNSIKIYPNPADGIVNLQFTIYDLNCVSLKIYNIYGKEIRTVLDGIKSPGDYSVRMDVSGLPAGIYLVRLHAGKENTATKLVIR